jgi:hypothetical protein
MAAKRDDNGDAPEVGQTPTTDAPSTGLSRNGLDMLLSLSSGASLTEDVEKYLKTINDILSKPDSSLSGKFKIQPLREPTGAHAIIVQNHVIVLIFTDLISGELQNFAPMSLHSISAYRSLPADIGIEERSIHFLNGILVSSVDYTKATQMAKHLINTFTTATNPDYDVSLAQFTGNNSLEFVIDFDRSRVLNFISDNTPHAVLPRVDEGFVVSFKKQRDRGSLRTMQGIDDTVPFMAVGWFTEFIMRQAPDSTWKFMPIARISSITTTTPVNGIELFALACAADVIINRRRWLVPYSSFRANELNLGNFFPDPNGGKSLYFTKNIQERDAIVGTHMLAPTLALDITEGQARIPGLIYYAGNDTNNAERLRNRIRKFLGIPIDQAIAPSWTITKEYIGTYIGKDGIPHDSRDVDYLNLVKTAGGLSEDFKKLLVWHEAPHTRTQIVSDNVKSFRSMHENQITIMNNSFIATLLQIVQNNVKLSYSSVQSTEIPTDALMAQIDLYTRMGGFTPLSNGGGAWRDPYAQFNRPYYG